MIRPRWRWLLFCAVYALYVRTDWRLARRLWAWAILPEWWGDPLGNEDRGGDPF